MTPLTISYERCVLNALLDDPDSSFAEQFANLDFHDAEDERTCLEYLRSLLESLTEYAAWKSSTEARVSVYGEFTCDGEGFPTGNGLTMQVFLDSFGICDVGIDSVWQLPLREEFTVFDLIDGTVAYFNELVRRLTGLLCPPPARSLALSVFPPDVVRSEATEDPHLSDIERARLRAATDEQIANAIDQAWPAVEDRWYAIHDELQHAAVRALVHE